MKNYLFVHFREKTTPDGEQVYFGLSKDGFHWESVNNGAPVLWAYYGDKGVRDFTVTRCDLTGKFYIVATDLSLAYGMRNQYHHSWGEIVRNGSHFFSLWESEDLVHWSEQRLVKIADEGFGCCWAPDIIKDNKTGDYIIHWSSPTAKDDFKKCAIYYSRTRDFEHFTKPELLFEDAQYGVIDSAITEENGRYYLFLKREAPPTSIALYCADEITGPYMRMEEFSESIKDYCANCEAPTTITLEDGKWCLFVDYYGVPGAGQGYIPFVSDAVGDGRFRRADNEFSFPYGFKHGTILEITPEEYDRIKNHDWSDKGWV